MTDLRAGDRFDSVRVEKPQNPRVITVSNQKGGVGKTTSAVNLAAALARLGQRVLVIDLDPQANATTALGLPKNSPKVGSYEVLLEELPLASAVEPTPEHLNLFALIGNEDLAGAEVKMANLVDRELLLRHALSGFLQTTESKFDYIFIDSPPSLGLLTVNALCAADEVLVPIQCEYYALEGLTQLLENIQRIRSALNPSLQLGPFLLTMFDSRTRLSGDVADDVRSHFPAETLQSIIPRSVRLSEAPSYGQTIVSYDPRSAGATAYLEAAVELAQRQPGISQYKSEQQLDEERSAT